MRVSVPIEESDINTLVCNGNTPDIVPSVSCYSDSVIIEIRDGYNLRYPRHFITNDDSDIKGILAKLKTQIGGREDAYLQVLPKEKKMLYKYCGTHRPLTAYRT